MTHLLAYLTDTKTTQSAMADRIGVSRGYFSQLVSGRKTPSLVVAVAIERETGGAVKAATLARDQTQGAAT